MTLEDRHLKSPLHYRESQEPAPSSDEAAHLKPTVDRGGHDQANRPRKAAPLAASACDCSGPLKGVREWLPRSVQSSGDGNVVRILWCLIELEVTKLVLPITRSRRRVVGYPAGNRLNRSRLSQDYKK